MRSRYWFTLAAGLLLGARAGGEGPPKPRHEVPPSKDGNLVLGLCDGETTLELEGVKDGTMLDRSQAQAASNELMAAWLKKNPDAKWEVAQAPSQPQPSPAQPPQKPGAPEKSPRSPAQLPPGQEQPSTTVQEAPGATTQGAGQIKRPATEAKVQVGHTYGNFSKRDEAIWRASTEEFVEFGNRVFHDAKELGGNVGISCDMCHPDASNTHPETYPKYQVQLGRAALLRDMINWCIENPVRGKPLPDDDEKLRAMEAYIFAKRKGTALDYGKK